MRNLWLAAGIFAALLLTGCQLSGATGPGPVTPSGPLPGELPTEQEPPVEEALPTPEPTLPIDVFATQTAQAVEAQLTAEAEPGGGIEAPTETPFMPPPTSTPTEGTPAPEPAGEACPPTHVVQSGENLFRIALRYGMIYQDLAAANGIVNPDRIVVGQVIRIPACGSSAAPQATGGEISHTVQPGENLFRIALRYGKTWAELAAYNGIGNPDQIVVGQVIRIPQP